MFLSFRITRTNKITNVSEYKDVEYPATMVYEEILKQVAKDAYSWLLEKNYDWYIETIRTLSLG